MRAEINTEQESPVIVGLEDIAAYLRRSKPTVRKMIEADELPVKLVRGAYMTSKSALNEWLHKKEVRTN